MDDTGFSRRRWLAATGSALSAALAGCALSKPESSVEPDTIDEPEGDFPDQPETPNGNVERDAVPSELTDVYDAVIDSVVAVEVQTSEGAAGGTAWVYEDSYLVTNEHVVFGGSNPYVWFIDTGWRQAEVVGTDAHSDLAVLEVDGKPEAATALSLVDQPQAVGTPVAAVGNPFNFTGSFTTGIISGRNRNIRVPGRDFNIADGIQTDAALNPGNSGGPLVTYDGEVVGVVTAGQGDNVGFAISAAMTRSVVPSLIEDGEYEHSYMGIRLFNVRPVVIETNDLSVPWGVYVSEVPEDGPSAGILQGADGEETVNGREVPTGGDVIVRMGLAEWSSDEMWTITDSERLSAFLALETEPGDTIQVEIVRDGERQTVEVTLGSRPDIDR
ncbi:serine protease [Halobacteriales archaeon QH_2_65_14]|nr:MAG: serine protease [Halobacteriales archaeon QH_2_65_14]